MVEIQYLSRNAVVIYKPHGIPSQADLGNRDDAMTLTAKLLREMGEADELWQVHRLDSVVGGLLLFARSKAAAEQITLSLKNRELEKEYLAVVEGRAEGGSFVDMIYKDSRTSRAIITGKKVGGAKEARLDARVLDVVSTDRGEFSLMAISLGTGRFHQIRAQLSSRGNSIVGDKKYGARTLLRGSIALASYHLALEFMGERVDVTALPKTDEHPWSMFAKEKYDELA